RNSPQQRGLPAPRGGNAGDSAGRTLSCRAATRSFPSMTITVPSQLACAVEEDDLPERLAWLEKLPGVIEEISAQWELKLGEPYLPGGQCAWVAPAIGSAGERLALKVGWRHREAEHEADALRVYDGDGAIRCFAESRDRPDTTALLLERCEPGRQLKWDVPEP